MVKPRCVQTYHVSACIPITSTPSEREREGHARQREERGRRHGFEKVLLGFRQLVLHRAAAPAILRPVSFVMDSPFEIDTQQQQLITAFLDLSIHPQAEEEAGSGFR
ncbi:hypothetical protein Hanom_Chr07g00639761 [Helianthus anomalus]